MKATRDWVAIVLLMSCGGAATPPPVAEPVVSTPAATDPGGPKPPFDPEAVRATLAAAPGNEACSAEAGETFAALMARQGALLGDASQVDERFRCHPPTADEGADAPWTCTWTVAGKPPATVDPADPCGGECCSSFSVQVEVDASGAARLASAACLAAG